MRVNPFLVSTRAFLEDVGYLRLSNFYSSENAAQGKIIQTIARVVLGIFAILGTYDLFSHSLPYQMRILVNGTFLVLTSCLCLSVVLKGVQQATHQPAEASTENQKDLPKDEIFIAQTPIKQVSPLEDMFEETPFSANPSVIDERPLPESERPSFSRVRRNLFPDFEKALHK